MKRHSPDEAGISLALSNDTFSMIFMDGDLRKVRFSGNEIIQRFYFAVRDKDWLNIPYTLNHFRKKETGSKTVCSYKLLFHDEDVHFETQMTVSFDNEKLTLEANGKALSSFLKNRIGFCVHLPVSMKGTTCKVFHADGTSSLSVFPELVSPHQPMQNIVSLEWDLTDGKAVLLFEGDVFEMEDQRNWTDASYKIYSTPLDIPFPVEVEEGQLFHQKITISVSSVLQGENRDSAIIHTPSAGKQESSGQTGNTLPWPSLGIACSNNMSALTSIQEHFGKTPFSFLRMDFRFHHPEWRSTACANISHARSFHLKIYAVLYFGNHFVREAHQFIEWVKTFDVKPDFHSITLLSSEAFVLNDKSLQQISCILRDFFHHDVPIGSGTDANFAQLNRNRPNPGCLDFIGYSIQPQEHASDPRSVIENLQGQTDTVKTAQSFSGGKDIHISALSIFRRFNANVNIISSNDVLHEYPYMETEFETGWFVGSLHQLIYAGADAVTCVCQLSEVSSILTLFNDMTKHTPELFYCCGSTKPEEYSVLSWNSKDKRHSVFANHTNRELNVVHPYAQVSLKPYAVFYFDE